MVRVVDQYGNGVIGVTVEWRTCDGTGDYNTLTDVGGYASAFQPTGPTPGDYCAMASSSGLAGSPVQFAYSVQPGARRPAPHRAGSYAATAGACATTSPPLNRSSLR